MRCPHCDELIDDVSEVCPVCNKDVRPVQRRADPARRLDPSAAIVDLESTTESAASRFPESSLSKRTKRCPFCAEDILAAAIVCKHCRSNVGPSHAPTVMLPFTPIVGATATSAWLYFLVVLVPFVFLSSTVPGIVVLGVLGSIIWVGFDASKHKLAQYESALSSPTIACLGSIALWIIIFPHYLGIRSRIRAGVQPVKT